MKKYLLLRKSEYKKGIPIMNRKLPLDIAIIISSITGAILSFVYLKTPTEKYISLAILTVYAVFFLVLTIFDATEDKRFPRYDTKKRGISEILLLGEDNNITDTWDIYGKTSIVFGRDEGSFQVDVNLKNTDYAGTIDGEHAVMNYSSGSWYIEDLDSENGTRIQRGGNGKVYKVSSREPCRVERGDIIYLGLAPIKVR